MKESIPLSQEELAVISTLVGYCAMKDEGLSQAKVGDIRSIISAVADALYEEDATDTKKQIYFTLLALGKRRATR